MKTAFTFRKWGFMLAFFSSMLFYYQAGAQRTAAKCAGFTAKITNGSVLNLCSGSSITLAATPATSGYTYQWQSQTTAGSPFSNIAGATGTSFATTNLGAYRVIVSTGSCIDTSGITSVVRIAVQGGTITPAQTTPICPGEAGGKITGSQVPGADLGFVTYSWEMNEDGAGWMPIQGALDADYTVPLLYKTTNYRRIAKDNCGNTAYSNVATLNIAAAVNPGSITPLTQTINRGETPAQITSVSPASGGTGNFTYQWQQSFWERGPFTNITGATGLSYQPGPLQETFYFRRVAKDTRCLTMSYSALAVVNVTNQILNAGDLAIPSPCFFPGQPASIILTFNPPRGGVPPYTIQWQRSTNNSTWTDIPGANGTNYNPGLLTQTTWFRKKVTDGAGTVAYTKSEVITMVTTTLTGGSIQGLSNVACLGSSPAQIKSTGSPTGYVGLGYQWQYKNASTGGVWTNIQGQIREALYPEPITEKTTYRRVAVDNCGASYRTANSNEFEIDIRPAIVAGDIEPTSQMVRSGQTPKPLNSVSSPSGGTGSFDVSWESAVNAIGPWSTITSVTALSYQPGSVTQSTYYRRAAMDKGCLATKYTYAVEVYLNTNPPVTGGNLGGSTCVFPGKRPSVITTGSNPPANGTAPFTYQWESSPGLTSTWTVIAGATSESYQPDVITQTMQYRRRITDYWGEFAYSEPFTVTIVSAPLNPGSIKTTTVVSCSGGTPALIAEVTPASGGGTFIGYQWQTKFDGGTWTDIAGATASTYQPGAITKRTYFRRAAMEKCGDETHTAYSNEVVIDHSLPVQVRLLAQSRVCWMHVQEIQLSSTSGKDLAVPFGQLSLVLLMPLILRVLSLQILHIAERHTTNVEVWDIATRLKSLYILRLSQVQLALKLRQYVQMRSLRLSS
jgi:hypothetical protein